jgi:Glycosyltransferase like family
VIGDVPGPSGISIVCVYNDPEVRQQCLDSSINAYSGDIDIDYIPVDNTKHAFTSAGAALNHGARAARHEVVVFVHQDVYLHSIDRLAAVAQHIVDGEWSLLGANGITSAAESIGRIRDRVQFVGNHAESPVEVDSVDEVLFMIAREQVLRYPLAEDSELAWHAYAVEYGLRLRTMGKRVGAVDLGVTHNSLTTNLDKLDLAHRSVGDRYVQLQPVWTTCGRIAGTTRPPRLDVSVVQQNRWRARWLKYSLQSLKIRRNLRLPVVFSDIRHDVDLLQFAESSPMYVFNLDRSGSLLSYESEPLELRRKRRPVIMRAVRSIPELLVDLYDLSSTSRVLVTDISLADAQEIASRAGERNWLVGIQYRAVWLLAGPDVQRLPSEWLRPQAVPFGQFRQRSRQAAQSRVLSQA